MKNLVLAPTEQNIINTLINDTLGRTSHLCNFIQLLNSVSGACTIALHGEWGSGKTFFVRQAKAILDCANDFTLDGYADGSVLKENASSIKEKFFPNGTSAKQLHYTVYYDAWKNDNHEDPIMSLVYTIVKNTHIDLDTHEDKLVSILKNLTKLVNVQISHTIASPLGRTEMSVSLNGDGVAGFIDSLKSKKPYKDIDDDESIKKQVNDLLDLILIEKANRLVIFIDELDRCRPTYAVKLLERIKHYFDNDRITFVFSVNLSELQCTIKNLYGNDFSASRYLDKFFDLTLNLPKIETKKFLLNCLKKDYTQVGAREQIILQVIKVYNLQLREIVRFISAVEIATNIISQREIFMDNPSEAAKRFVTILCVPILIALKMTDATQYTNFVKGNNSRPFFSVAYNEELKFFLKYLSSDNSNDIQSLQAPLINKDILESAYLAIFKEEYDGNSHRIGKCALSAVHRKLISDLESMLTDWADYNVLDY